MENKNFNFFTLLPDNRGMLKHLERQVPSKLKFLIIVSITFAFISCLNSLAFLFYNIGAKGSYENSLIIFAADAFRVMYYSLTLMLAKISWKFQAYVTHTFPIVYSIVVTEIYTYTGSTDGVVVRVLSTTGIVLMHAKYIPFSFSYAMIPVLFSLIYPFLRVTGIFPEVISRVFTQPYSGYNKHHIGPAGLCLYDEEIICFRSL